MSQIATNVSSPAGRDDDAAAMEHLARLGAWTLLVLSLAACSSPTNTPEGVIRRLMAAAAADDEAAWRACLVAAERNDESLSYSEDTTAGPESLELEPAQIDGDRATVRSMMKDAPFQPTFVCRLEGGAWRVSLNETIEETLGFNPNQLAETMAESMAESMGDAMKEMSEEMAEEFGHALEEAARDATPPRGGR